VRPRVVSKGTLPTFSYGNVLLPGRETPAGGAWILDDAWHIACGGYQGGSYKPLTDGQFLKFGTDMIPLCLAAVSKQFPDQGWRDFFDTFDPGNTSYKVGEVVSLQSNWAVVLPGFANPRADSYEWDKNIYLIRLPITTWVEIAGTTGPPSRPVDPLIITQHPQIRLTANGTGVEFVPGSTAQSAGGVEPRSWGEWTWEYSDDNQVTWKTYTDQGLAGKWLRVYIDAFDAAGATARAQSNTVKLSQPLLEWVMAPTFYASLDDDGNGDLSFGMYSYTGGEAPYTDSRVFEVFSGGAWVPTSTVTTYSGPNQFRGVASVRSNDGQTLSWTSPPITLTFGSAPSTVIGTAPTVVQHPIIRVERDGPNPGDMVWLRCVEPPSVSIPPQSTYWYVAEYRLSNGGVLTRYDSRTDQMTPGDVKGYTHGTAQLVYTYTITTVSFGVVTLEAKSNVVEYDIRAWVAVGTASDCSIIPDRNTRAICEAIAAVLPFPPSGLKP
jgi:hypothetical protein